MEMITVSAAALNSIDGMVAHLQAERDELLAALQRIVATNDCSQDDDVALMIEYGESLVQARQAIANATND